MLRAVKNKQRLFLGVVRAPSDMTTAKFVYFYGPKFDDKAIYELDDAKSILQHDKFNPTNKTVLYLHGYAENMDVESIQVIAEAYCQRHDINLIILDWGELADGNYLLDAVGNAKQLGSRLAGILLDLFNGGLNIEHFHLVGHSLGGQMAGIIGRVIKRKSKETKILPRITALDPAFPPFYFGLTKHICKTDAIFVDIIHTDAWLYGAPISSGTVDFWPNSGKTLQPGCPRRNYKILSDNVSVDLSSHRRSWWFWAESVANRLTSDQFIAVKSKSWSDFKSNRFIAEKIDNLIVCMGDDCPTNISGDYYLQTNGQKPFARGPKGIRYVPNGQLLLGTSESKEIFSSRNTIH